VIDLSHLDTSVGALIRSGAAILGILLGGFILSARPRTWANAFLGLGAVFDGLGYAIYSLAGGFSRYPHKELVVPTLTTTTVLSVLSAALLLAFAWPHVRRLTHRKAALGLALLAFVGLVGLAPFLIFVAGGHQNLELHGSPEGVRAAELDAAAFALYLGVVAVVTMALLEAIRRDPDDPHNRGRLLLAGMLLLTGGTSNISGNLAIAAGALPAQDFDAVALARIAFVVAALVLLPVLLWPLSLRHVGPWPRGAAITVMLVALSITAIETVLLMGDLQDGGFGGIASLLGLGAFAAAIFRFDLLGAHVWRPTAGVLASVALATLFITAQVAQNFLSDELGLILGGITAGAAVFVAYPLQRAAERALERDAKRGPKSEYRALVEHAWSDGKFGPKERLMLSETRRRLGLGAEAAQAIEDDVAKGVRRGA